MNAATVANASSLAPKAAALIAPEARYRLDELERLSGVNASTLRTRLEKEGVEIAVAGVLGFDIVAVDSDELPIFRAGHAGQAHKEPTAPTVEAGSVPRVRDAGFSDAKIYTAYEAAALLGGTINGATIGSRIKALGFDPKRLTKEQLLKADPDAKPLFRAPDPVRSANASLPKGPRDASGKDPAAAAKNLFALAADLRSAIAKHPGLSKDEIREAFRFAERVA